MAGIGSTVRSIWHSLTSNDRHATHDSPFRTGGHMPLNQSRHAPLTSVATSAMDSRPDLNSPFTDDGTGSLPQSPSAQYSPGMRSSQAQRRGSGIESTMEPVNTGEIQMQSFSDGLPPPPPVTHSWKRIERWTEDNYTELFDNLSEGCTQNDLNELEHDLDCSLPLEVRESLQCHDGQERGGQPTGIIFGCMLLDCEEIVQEWRNWKTVNEEYLNSGPHGAASPQHQPGYASSSSSPVRRQGQNPFWRQELLEKQDSQPPRAIQRAYAHPAWIPLARDWGGNNLAVDLAPGPAGKWGQVIIFGRDFDIKVVVARSWSAFMAMVADDIGSDKVFVDEDTQELKFRVKAPEGVEPAYLDILRWRMDQKYGRRVPKKKAPNGVGPGPRRASPYGSPERGRSPQRFPGRGPGSQSPRVTPVVSSPLAQVSEHPSKPAPIRSSSDGNKLDGKALLNGKPEKLIEAPTPTVPVDPKKPEALESLDSKPKDSSSEDPAPSGLGVEGIEGELKTVQI